MPIYGTTRRNLSKQIRQYENKLNTKGLSESKVRKLVARKFY